MKHGRGWPIAVGAILLVTVAANLAALYVADDDPSFAIEADYYQKAVHYDDQMTQELRNERLGWRLTPTIAPLARSGAVVTVRLTDAHGVPLTGVRLRVAALFNARANDVLDATLVPQRDSDYTGRLPMHHAGEWELRFEAVRGGQRFTAVRRVDVALAGTGS